MRFTSCDVIVNSTHERLFLSYGAVSSSILKKAGQPIQGECNEFMRHRANISSTDVVVTKGYGLNCKHVFHGALASWKDQTLEVFVYNCLKEAEERKLSTIAFPSLGTGNLNYPTKFVTRTMFQTVQKYAQKNNFGHLKEVHFVIYGKDSNALQEFLLEEKIQSTAGRKEESHKICPNPSFIQITVTGENETYVDNTFQMIVKLLKGEKDKTEVMKDDLSKAKEDSLRYPHKQQTKTKPDHSLALNFNDYTKRTRSGRVHPSLKDSDFDLPPNWSAMEDNENLKIVRLQSSDIEYIEVEQQFKSWKNMGDKKILQIERIQSRYLYQQYIAKKKFMDSQNRSGQNNESTLWHGTDSEAINSINTYGFNRNYCGKNAASYGNGVYFAVDPSYSAKNTYARPDTLKTKRMYMCKVLVGDYTQGHHGMRVPPQKGEALGSHILYDSVVDNPKSPMIFVSFHDAQAYPTYLITFDDKRNSRKQTTS